MKKKQNLLYVFADQWRAEAMGWQNQDQAVTPNIDRFASESLRCTNAYSTFPLCSPHRACLMTGKYPLKTGIWTNCKTGLDEILMLKPQETCIGNVLKKNGYQTGYIGKWHLDAPELNFTDKPASGADGWDAYTPPGERRQGFDYWLSYGTYDEHLAPHYWKNSEVQIQPGKWSVEYETDKAIEYMEERKEDERPFALFLSYNPPHPPYEQVPDIYYKKYEDMKINYRENVPEHLRTPGGRLETIIRQYLAAVYGLDREFGRILDYLKKNNMEEDTLVVLSADHGDTLGSHGIFDKNIWYKESIHIPLMIRQKGKIEEGNYEEIFASVDHMPTVLGLLDLPVPDTCEGCNHAGYILDNSGEVPSEMFLCSYPGLPEMVSSFTKNGLTQKAYGWRGIKAKDYTYVVSNGYMAGEEQKEYLYDAINDPYEMSPRMISEDCDEDMVKEKRRHLRKYLDSIGDPFLFDRE